MPDRNGLEGVKHIIAVSSGKGGVGKSTVAVNLAVALQQMGSSTGLLDTDVYGPNTPTMMGTHEQPRVEGHKLLPVMAHAVKMMSIGLLNPGDKPVIWRGPMLHSAVQQFLTDVFWAPLDYLIIDMPPGTGDVQLSLAQLVPVSGGILVTTPQEVSLGDVRKAHNMFVQVGIPVLGFIENMSYFICPNCRSRHEIFGHGGGRQLAEKFGADFLGEIPLSTNVREGGDNGVPVVVGAPDSPPAEAFRQVARATAERIRKVAAQSVKLPVLK